MANQATLIPFLKWAGGKRWLIQRYPNIFPQNYGRYIEPFLGSGAVFFFLQPKESLLADINCDLIDTYKSIRRHQKEVLAALSKHQRAHDDDYYYTVRDRSPKAMIDRAAQFIYLNRTCWNGLYRVNQRGKFNVPRGTKNDVLMSTDDFAKVSCALRGAKLLAQDFEITLDAAKRRDLVFVDPPYTVKHNVNGFLKYNDKIFSWEDQIRLKDAVVRAHNRGATIVMTNANHASIRELYEDFSLQSLARYSVLSGLASGRGKTEELLITNLHS